MALSGTIYTNYYNSHIRLKLSWSGTQSVANNTTKISWTLTSNGGSSGSWWMAGPVTVKIGNNTVLNTTSRFKMYGGGAYKKTGSITISHRADGTQSVSMSVKAAIYTSSVNCTGSSTFTLNKIDRYALITAYESFTDESNPTISYTNPQGPDAVTGLKVRITWNNGAGYTSWYFLNDDGGTVSLSLTTADRELLRAATPNSNTLTVKFDLMSTMDGSGWHDYKETFMEIVNANPIMSNALEFLSGEQYIEDITGSEYTIIQERSTINALAKYATAQKGATIVSYSLSFAGTTYTPEIRTGDIFPVHVTIGHLDIAGGTYTATLTATDSRGNSSTETTDVLVYGWVQPSALYSFERVQDFTTNDAVLHVDGNISDIPGNTLLITESHREKGVGDWSQPVTVPDNEDFIIHNLDYKKDYELIITVSDSFTRADDPETSTTYTVTIGKGIPLMFLDTLRSSVSINGIPDGDDQLFVGGTIHAKPNDTDAGVVLPHTYSTTEQIVSYWTDGRPIYELTVELSSDATVNANAWNDNVYTHSENIIILGGEALYYDSNLDVYANWSFIGFHTVSSDKKKVGLYNSRDSSCLVNILILRYIKPT